MRGESLIIFYIRKCCHLSRKQKKKKDILKIQSITEKIKG